MNQRRAVVAARYQTSRRKIAVSAAVLTRRFLVGVGVGGAHTVGRGR